MCCNVCSNVVLDAAACVKVCSVCMQQLLDVHLSWHPEVHLSEVYTSLSLKFYGKFTKSSDYVLFLTKRDRPIQLLSAGSACSMHVQYINSVCNNASNNVCNNVSNSVCNNVYFMQQSGLSDWIGERLTLFEDLPREVIALFISFLVASLTEVISNIATTVLFLPILRMLVRKAASMGYVGL